MPKKAPEKALTADPRRNYSIIVWGASGFVGKLVCQHIAQDYPVRPDGAVLSGAGSLKHGFLQRQRPCSAFLGSRVLPCTPQPTLLLSGGTWSGLWAPRALAAPRTRLAAATALAATATTASSWLAKPRASP